MTCALKRFALGIGLQNLIHAVPTRGMAFCAIPWAASGPEPKPTQTGNLVCRLMRATASPTTAVIAMRLPVMPVMET